MICNKCGGENEDKNNFCKNCGQNFKADHASDPNYSIFDSTYIQEKKNTDIGFLVVSIIITVNILAWLVWSWVASSLHGEYRTTLQFLQIFGSICVLTQFVFMLLFTNKPRNKVLIGILGFFVLIVQIINLVRIINYF
jgi:Na+-translocating ferredoxin:NAD+ oxidoreductase RnfA subunit